MELEVEILTPSVFFFELAVKMTVCAKTNVNLNKCKFWDHMQCAFNVLSKEVWIDR